MKRVFCLAGANGLGKSTFMAALNFGLTGRVPEPERQFRSVEEYFQHTEDYSGRYFEGRIGELDREEAEIDLVFVVGATRFTLTRGLFEPAELRQLSIIDGDRAIEIDSSGPHHQDSGEAKIRESTAGVSRKPSSDCKACGCSSKHLCGLTAWNT